MTLRCSMRRYASETRLRRGGSMGARTRVVACTSGVKTRGGDEHEYQLFKNNSPLILFLKLYTTMQNSTSSFIGAYIPHLPQSYFQRVSRLIAVIDAVPVSTMTPWPNASRRFLAYLANLRAAWSSCPKLFMTCKIHICDIQRPFAHALE